MDAVVGTDQRVGLRIPDRLVNAVEDAREALAPLQQHALHASTALRRGDLVGIARADRAQPVGKHQPALHEAAVPVVFQAAGHPRPQDVRRQVQPRRLLQREEPLVDQVVDAEHGLHPAHRVQRQIHWRQPRVPVMRMQDVSLPPGIDIPPGQMRPHPAQQRKAPDVVGPVTMVRTQIGVAFAPEVPGRIHDIGRQTALFQPPVQHPHAGGPHQGTQVGHQAGLFQVVDDGRIARHQQPGIHPLGQQGRRQGGRNVAQPARLDLRIHLGRDMQDPHIARRRAIGLLPDHGRHGRASRRSGRVRIIGTRSIRSGKSAVCKHHRSSGRSALQFFQHPGGDQRHAALAAIEAPCIIVRILADHQAIGNPAAPVDHHLGEPDVAPHLHLG